MSGWLGRTIGNYRIDAALGLGGMGRVFRAVHVHINRVAAIKVLHEQFAVDPTFQARFLREAQAAAALHHPNIVDVIDFNEADGTFYLVMEYVPDGSLRGLLKEQAAQGHLLPLATGLTLIRQAAEALDYAHRAGMVHRDIKPDNLLLRREPATGELTVKVADFGLARLGDSTILTAEGQAMGTPAYMSPEQCQGTDLDGRSDIYSLGVVLFEVATGAVPFAMKSLTDAIYKHVYVAPPSPQEVRADLPDALNEIILRCLAKQPADRFQTAGELASALGDLLAQRRRDEWSQPTLYVPVVPVEPLTVRLDTGEVPLTPGEVSLLKVTIANRGNEAVAANISIEGVPEAWVATPPRDIEIAPGAEVSGPLRIEVPPDASIVSGEYPVIVRATARENQAISATATTRLRVIQPILAPQEMPTQPPPVGAPPGGDSMPSARSGAGDASGTPRWLAIAAVAVLLLAVAGVGYALLGNDDDDPDSLGDATVTTAASTATGPARTATPEDAATSSAATATGVIVVEPATTPTELAAATEPASTATEAPATATETPAFALPDEFIMFTAGRNLDDPAGTLDIYIMDPSGADQRPIISEPDDDWLAALSPDQSRIVWASRQHGNHQLYIGNVDGSDVRRLTTSTGDDLHPFWSPDGVHIVFVRNEDGDDELYQLNVDDGTLTRLTDNDAYDGYSVWSPDGSRLAWTSGVDGSNEIYSLDMTTPGATPQRLTAINANSFHPIWSPDGEQIVFVSNVLGDNDLFLIQSDGTAGTLGKAGNGPELLQADAFDAVGLANTSAEEYAPAWSPDGSRIAFCRRTGTAPACEVVVINADGTGEQILATNASPNDPDITWAPDSTRLAYLSEDGGNYDVWTVSLTGGDAIQLTDAPGNDANLSWIVTVSAP